MKERREVDWENTSLYRIGAGGRGIRIHMNRDPNWSLWIAEKK